MVCWSGLGRRAAAADKIILHIFIQMLPGEESKHKIFLVSPPDYFLGELQTTEQQRGHIIIMTLIILLHLANTALVGAGVDMPSFTVAGRTFAGVLIFTGHGSLPVFTPGQPVREEKWATEKILTLPCFCFSRASHQRDTGDLVTHWAGKYH